MSRGSAVRPVSPSERCSGRDSCFPFKTNPKGISLPKPDPSPSASAQLVFAARKPARTRKPAETTTTTPRCGRWSFRGRRSRSPGFGRFGASGDSIRGFGGAGGEALAFRTRDRFFWLGAIHQATPRPCFFQFFFGGGALIKENPDLVFCWGKDERNMFCLDIQVAIAFFPTHCCWFLG